MRRSTDLTNANRTRGATCRNKKQRQGYSSSKSERIISERLLQQLRASPKRVDVQHITLFGGFPPARISTLVRYLTRNMCPEDYGFVQLRLNQDKNPAHSTPPIPPMIRNQCIMTLSQNELCGKVFYFCLSVFIGKRKILDRTFRWEVLGYLRDCRYASLSIDCRQDRQCFARSHPALAPSTTMKMLVP